jgi:putative ABC transport system permease protein
MRLATTLMPALHALRVHRLRTGLALLGICFGVAAIVIIVALGSMTQAKLDAEINQLGADVLLVWSEPTRNKGASSAERSLVVTEGDAEAIAREISGIIAVAPALRGVTQIVAGNRNRAAIVRGVTPDMFVARPWPLTMGRPLDEEDVRRSGKVALLGHGIASALFSDEDPAGQIVRIKQVPFIVASALDEKGPSLDGDDLDNQVFIPITTARKRILGFFRGHPTAVGGITLRVDKSAELERVSAAARKLLRERHRLGPNDPDDFVVRDLAAAQRAQARSARLTTLMLIAAAAVSLLVGGVGIMNAMLVTVSERRQEIGLRMAVGARRRDIAWQFLIEAGLLALLGSGVGVLLGLFGTVALGAGAAIGSSETGMAILFAAGAATMMTLLSSFYPSRKAASLDPAEALTQS